MVHHFKSVPQNGQPWDQSTRGPLLKSRLRRVSIIRSFQRVMLLGAGDSHIFFLCAAWAVPVRKSYPTTAAPLDHRHLLEILASAFPFGSHADQIQYLTTMHVFVASRHPGVTSRYVLHVRWLDEGMGTLCYFHLEETIATLEFLDVYFDLDKRIHYLQLSHADELRHDEWLINDVTSTVA